MTDDQVSAPTRSLSASRYVPADATRATRAIIRRSPPSPALVSRQTPVVGRRGTGRQSLELR